MHNFHLDPHLDPEIQTLPAIESFQRLHVVNGLRLTAQRWLDAQAYTRRRQNFYFQALHQSGIVRGFEVTTIPAPPTVNSHYQDGFWLLVQPGIAIDATGNPIVMETAQTFHVQSRAASDQALCLIHLVIQYVDPDECDYPADQEHLPELFRLVEKTQLGPEDVELCRLQIDAQTQQLQPAVNVFAPQLNELDLRYRLAAQLQPRHWVQVAQVVTGALGDPSITHQLEQLLLSTEGLFPRLTGSPKLEQLPLADLGNSLTADILNHTDLLYLSYKAIRQLTPTTLTPLKHYLEQGGTLLIMTNLETQRLGKLQLTKQELLAALEQLDPGLSEAERTDIRTRLRSEIAAYDAEISQAMQGFSETVSSLAQGMDYPLQGGYLDGKHPLRTFPFLFSALPQINGVPISILNWDGIVMVLGDLAIAWGPSEQQPLARDTIRTAHELGINLLYFAWRRRQLMQAQHVPAAAASANSTRLEHDDA